MKWDAHEDLHANHGKNARVLDKRTAALLKDLKPRGLLDETLVVFTTEFGLLPISEGVGEEGSDVQRTEMGYKAADHPVTWNHNSLQRRLTDG